MAGFVEELIGRYQKHLERNRTRPFLDSVMAACALVAIAEGKVTFSHRVHIDQVIDTLEELKVFDPHEAVDLFNEYVAAIRKSPSAGRKKALDSILREVRDDPEKARLLIRICLAVSELNGEIPMADQIEIVALCSRINVDPDEFELYTENLPNL